MNSFASGFYPSPDEDEYPDPNKAGQEVAGALSRDRNRVTDSRHMRSDANYDRDATGLCVTCAEVDELGPTSHGKADLEQGLAFRRRW